MTTGRTTNTRARARKTQPESNKAYQVYFSEDAFSRDVLQREQTQDNLASMIKQQRTQLATPDMHARATKKEDQKPDTSKAKADQRTEKDGEKTSADALFSEIPLPPSQPKVLINLKYQQIDEVAKAPGYLKHIPAVFHDHPMFNFIGHDYELRVKDREYLTAAQAKDASLPPNEQFGFNLMNPQKLERMIDCIEKICYFYNDKKPDLISSKFKDYCDFDLRSLPNSLIAEVVSKYWRVERIEQKWHCFMRIFWENPDFNEHDFQAAFRKRSEKERMKTRPKITVQTIKLEKRQQACKQTIDYMLHDILPMMFRRTAIKQSLHKIADTKFDTHYEKMCADKNLQNSTVLSKVREHKWTAEQLKPKSIEKHLQIRIELPEKSEQSSDSELPDPRQHLKKQDRFNQPTIGKHPNPDKFPQKNQIPPRNSKKGAHVIEELNQKRPSQIINSQEHSGQHSPTNGRIVSEHNGAAANQSDKPQNSKKQKQIKRAPSNVPDNNATESQIDPNDKTKSQEEQKGEGFSNGGQQVAPQSNKPDPANHMQQKTNTWCQSGSMDNFTLLTQLLQMMQQSGAQFASQERNSSGFRQTMSQKQFLNPLDTQPRIPTIFEPGQAHYKVREREAEAEAKAKEDKERAQNNDAEMKDPETLPVDEPSESDLFQQFEQAESRNFVVRRGRNNRCLFSVINKGVFKDKDAVPKSRLQAQPRVPGQKFFMKKYREDWLTLGKRQKSGNDISDIEQLYSQKKQSNRGRKPNPTNRELFFESNPYLQKYAKARQNFLPPVDTLRAAPIASVPVLGVVKAAGMKVQSGTASSSRNAQDKLVQHIQQQLSSNANVQNYYQSGDASARGYAGDQFNSLDLQLQQASSQMQAPLQEQEEQEKIMQEQVAEIQDLANYDFVQRKRAKREFLMNFLNGEQGSTNDHVSGSDMDSSIDSSSSGEDSEMEDIELNQKMFGAVSTSKSPVAPLSVEQIVQQSRGLGSKFESFKANNRQFLLGGNAGAGQGKAKMNGGQQEQHGSLYTREQTVDSEGGTSRGGASNHMTGQVAGQNFFPV